MCDAHYYTECSHADLRIVDRVAFFRDHTKDLEAPLTSEGAVSLLQQYVASSTGRVEPWSYIECDYTNRLCVDT